MQPKSTQVRANNREWKTRGVLIHMQWIGSTPTAKIIHHGSVWTFEDRIILHLLTSGLRRADYGSIIVKIKRVT